jgi:signal transduction histidine kinase
VNWLRSISGRLSITARITVGSFVVAVLIGVIAVIGIRLGVSAILDDATVTLLRHDAEPFEQQLRNHPTDIDAAPGEGQYVAIVSPSGDVRMSSLPKSLRPDGRVDFTGVEAITEVTSDGRRYIVRASPVATSAGTFHVVSARNEDANALVLTRLSVALIIGAAVLVACFTLASFILARTALRPVNVMRRQADELARRQSRAEANSMRRGDPSGARASGRASAAMGYGVAGSDVGPAGELLEVPPVRDELAALAVTLNGLIDALRASADREKQLVSDASHELRTPLAVLRGELELAELDAGDAGALLADVRQAQQTVLRLSTLATNLLELSRIDAHGHRGSATWAELEGEIAAAIDRMRQASAMRGIQCVIDFDVAADAPAADTIALSAQEFGRVVDNLISNSITAIGVAKGAGTITARLDRSGDTVRLTIVDDGPGMPADFMPIALDRFTRVDAARNTTTGSGLGLAIVAALVDASRGDIRFSPSPTGGLTVVVEWPVGSATA